MREITMEEQTEVNGGIIPLVVAIITVDLALQATVYAAIQTGAFD